MLLVAGCGDSEPDPWLTALQHERLATMVPPGGKLVLDAAFEGHDGFPKPTRARVSRVFAFRSRGAATRGRDAVLAAADSSGWNVDRRRDYTADPFYGSKRLPLGGATLTVGRYRKGDAFDVSVRLEEGECPPQLCGG